MRLPGQLSVARRSGIHGSFSSQSVRLSCSVPQSSQTTVNVGVVRSVIGVLVTQIFHFVYRAGRVEFIFVEEPDPAVVEDLDGGLDCRAFVREMQSRVRAVYSHVSD